MTNNIYGLYKRITKRDPKAIDDIQTLDEAKEIIKMLVGSSQGIKTNNGLYPMNFVKCLDEEIKAGSKIFCEGEHSCLKLEENLNDKGIKTKIECNEAGMWSIYIVSVPKNYNKRQ